MKLQEEELVKSYYKQSLLHFGLGKIFVYFKCYFTVDVYPEGKGEGVRVTEGMRVRVAESVRVMVKVGYE